MARNIARPKWSLCCVGLLLGGCLGGGDAVGPNVGNNGAVSPNEGQGVITQTEIPRAQCREGDRPELALQGQVPLSDRLAGFQGNNCNIDLVSQYEGEGTSWMHTSYRDCSYYGQAFAATAISSPSVPRASLQRPGTVVMDVSDSSNPVDVGRLTSVSMLDPWESLKVNVQRGLLAAVNGTSSGGGPEFDVYDISQDCSQPRLLFSGPLADDTVIGHEGEWAPDGLTYYGGDLNQGQYYAIDVSNPSAPEFITKFTPPVGVHGLSVSPDGTRGYVTLSGTARNEGNNTNGFAIYDFTPISKRMADPSPVLLAEVYWADGSVAQHTIPVKIAGKDHLITVDELGSDGVNAAASRIVTCGYFNSGLRVFDISTPDSIKEIAYFNPAMSPGQKGGSTFNVTGNCFGADWTSSQPRFVLKKMRFGLRRSVQVFRSSK